MIASHLSTRHKWITFLALVFLLVCPTRSFVGLIGNHWFFGIPFDTLMIKYGGFTGGDVSSLSVDFSGIGWAIDIILWLVCLVLFVCYVKR